jgi:hypothetical protein
MAQTTLATSASASTALSLTSTQTTPTWGDSAKPTPPPPPSSTRLSSTTQNPATQQPTGPEGPASIAPDPASTAYAAPATELVLLSKQVAISLLPLTFPASRVVTPPTDRTREKVATGLTAPACKSTTSHTRENLRRAGGTTSVRISDERVVIGNETGLNGMGWDVTKADHL